MINIHDADDQSARRRLTKILGYGPNEVMKPERTGYQGKGSARRLGRRESYRERKDRLAAQGRDLAAERLALRRRRTARMGLRIAS
jgi:hypothetical protein